MEMHAYSKLYLDNSMETLAEMFDFAVNDCGKDLTEFANIFTVTSISSGFEKGHPKYIAGMSGAELVYEVYGEAGERLGEIEVKSRMHRSPEYWFGFMLAYYQWRTGKSFREILKKVSPENILSMYRTLHEADIEKFVDVMNQKIEEAGRETNLKRLRQNAGLSQAELSRQSGVSLRSIQMYEQKNKDINKAQTVSVVRMARVLGCQVEDLLE